MSDTIPHFDTVDAVVVLLFVATLLSFVVTVLLLAVVWL